MIITFYPTQEPAQLNGADMRLHPKGVSEGEEVKEQTSKKFSLSVNATEEHYYYFGSVFLSEKVKLMFCPLYPSRRE